MNIVIKKAAIKGSLFLSYEFDQTDLNVKNNIKTSSDAPIHDDLRDAFRRLIPHFAYICEEVTDVKLVGKAISNPEAYLSDKDEAPDDTFFKYRVISFSITDKKGIELLQLSGAKQLENNEEIPFSTYDFDISDSEYKFITELNEAIDNLKNEVLEYMQGKSAPKAQMEMFPEVGDDSEEVGELDATAKMEVVED